MQAPFAGVETGCKRISERPGWRMVVTLSSGQSRVFWVSVCLACLAVCVCWKLVLEASEFVCAAVQGDKRPEFELGVCLDEDQQFERPGWPTSEEGKTMRELKVIEMHQDMITQVVVDRPKP